ncbi:MAG: methyltransferase, partial [Pseudomonadota bacterium]|nr:methyltransferase [Pseudomonadota bacterium]
LAYQPHFSAVALTQLFQGHVAASNILLFMPKEKALAEMLIHLIKQKLTSSAATIYLVGDKRSGIQSFAKNSSEDFQKQQSLSHHYLYTAQIKAAQATAQDGIQASETRNKETLSKKTQIKDTLSSKEVTGFFQSYEHDGLRLFNLPSVFSFQKPDEGSLLLIPHFKDFPAERVLDFGCGSGLLTCSYLKQHPKAQLDALDANAFALLSTEKSAQANRQTLNQTLLSNGLQLVNTQYDLIFSNPPFHQGQEQTYDIAKQFIADAHRHLKPGGKLLIVANRFLPYEPTILSTFGNCKELSNNSRYKIIASYKKS